MTRNDMSTITRSGTYARLRELWDMRFTLEIDMDNAAFGDTDATRADEVARILRQIADRLERSEYLLAPFRFVPLDTERFLVSDTNGNTVGNFTVGLAS